MKTPIFVGSGVAMTTPFKDNKLDFNAFAKQIDFQISGGTDALIVCGTTGEPSTMSEEERFEAIAFAIDRAGGRIPVIAGTGGNNTAGVIKDSVRAQELGADALLIVTPYYNKTTQAGMVAHYTAIAQSTSLPIIVYNVPSRTGLNMAPETLHKLSKISNINAMKEASGDVKQIIEMARLCGDDINFYSGNDDHVLAILAAGGKGVITVAGNVIPRMVHDMVDKWLNGDIAGSRELQFKINPLVDSLFLETNPTPVKAAMKMLGMDSGEVRLPLITPGEATLAAIRRELKALSLL